MDIVGQNVDTVNGHVLGLLDVSQVLNRQDALQLLQSLLVAQMPLQNDGIRNDKAEYAAMLCGLVADVVYDLAREVPGAVDEKP